MHIDAKDLDAVKSHHLLRNLVMPRPIALISTVNREGLVNVAPFAFGGDEGAHDFVIAEVVAFHVQDKLGKNGAPDCLGMNVLGRLGDDYYAGVREPREMKRLRYADFMSGRSPQRS